MPGERYNLLKRKFWISASVKKTMSKPQRLGVKETVRLIMTSLSVMVYPHSCGFKPVTDFLQWNTKADVLLDVHTALCYTVKVEDDQGMSSPKKTKGIKTYLLYITCYIMSYLYMYSFLNTVVII